MEEDESNIERIYQKDLVGLDYHGSPCENCGDHMHNHEWADMDIHGFVVNCSKKDSDNMSITLNLVQFENGRYGLRNSLTGWVVPNRKQTGPYMTRFQWRALREANRRTSRLNRTVSQLGRR